MVIALIIIVLLGLVIFLYTSRPMFGQSASGQRLERIKKSPNFVKGKFQNLHVTPQLTEGYSIAKILFEFIFKKAPGRVPIDKIPSMKTDLLRLPPGEDVLVWFGHSSYFMQIDGKKFLVDPVFSGNASPIPGSNKAFRGTDRYTTDDLPEIDYLFVTHDHYDHADYETLVKLRPKIKKVICGLGVGAHLERWNYAPEIIIEKDWYESLALEPGFSVHTCPARHFSGRGFTRNTTLWMSFVLRTPSLNIYIGGDSGYDTHFAEIGNQYGPFDLAILENGQYDIRWKYIHALPGEALQAAKDLKAKRLLPVHSSKFAMANHAWKAPLAEITELNKSVNMQLITPLIGEAVNLKDDQEKFSQWWLGVK